MEREEYSRRMQFEHELINRRLTWLLTAQSLLFAAYGVGLDKGHLSFLKTVAATGAAIAILVLIGTLAAFAAKFRTWQEFKAAGHPIEEFWVRTSITYVAFASEVALPLVFGIAWAFLF